MDYDVLCRWCAFVEDMLYMAFLSGAVAEYNMMTGKLKPMGAIAGLDLKKIISGPTYVYRSKIFIVDNRGKEIFVLDTKENSIHAISVDAGDESFRNYYGGCLYNGQLYLFPHKKKQYIKIDCRTEECRYVANKTLYGNFVENEDTACARKESRFFFLPRSGERLFCLDLDRNDVCAMRLPERIADVRQMFWRDEGLYILSGDGAVDLWTEENDLCRINASITEKPMRFSRFACAEKRLWILPGSGEKIYCFDLAERKLSEYTDYPSDYEYLRGKEWLRINAKFMEFTQNDSYICFLNRAANCTLFLDKNTGEIFWRQIGMKPLARMKFRRENKGDYFLKEEEMSLRAFLALVKNKEISEWEDDSNENVM